MTTVTGHPSTSTADGAEPAREAYRRELAGLLGEEPADLPDQADLVHDLGLDSLAMMRTLVWLEQKGVTVDTDRSRPGRVADLLALAGTAEGRGMAIRITDGRDPVPAAATELPPAPGPAADPLAPVLTGHGLRLDPVTPDDVGFLYTLAVGPETGYRWRYHGVPPSIERFTEGMWRDVVTQYVVRRTENGQPVGQVLAYGADPVVRYVNVGAVFVPAHTGTGLAARAVALFVGYLFHTLPLAKVYLEIPGYNWPQVRSGEDRLFRVEGVLRDHVFYAGRTWDQYLCAVYRDHFHAGVTDAPPMTGGTNVHKRP